MSWEPKSSIVRILAANGATQESDTAGTGFFVTEGEGALIATCAHVIANAGKGPDETVEVEFDRSARAHPTILRTRVERDYWRDPTAEDIALLRLSDPFPDGCSALVLAPRLNDETRVHKSWGFPTAKATEGLGADVNEFAPATDARFPALSAQSTVVSHGFSGAPVWDFDSDVVVGMVMSIIAPHADTGGRQQTAFFLRPAEELCKVCPKLRGSGENPYRGLDVFEEQHADVYYGRDRAITELLRQLNRRDFVAVVGISGSGKSSLVQAGLCKGLRRTAVLGLESKPRILFRPGPLPLSDLELSVAASSSRGEPASARDPALDEMEVSGASLHERPEQLPRATPGDLASALRRALSPRGAILVVDQFERLFTHCSDETERRRFVDTLLALASEDVKVLVTLRADFYGRALELPMLGEAVEHGQVTLRAMTSGELLAAITEPARAHLRKLEPGLAELLMTDVKGNPGDLPLLQLALTELWERDAEHGLLRSATYEALGRTTADGGALRVRGVVAQLAEKQWQRLTPAEQTAATGVLVKLVAPAGVVDALDGTGRAARRASQFEWDDPTQVVVSKLVDARLLTTGSDAVTGEAIVEVAHEALIWAWPRLRRLAVDHAEFMRWYDRDCAPPLTRWMSERSPEWLLRGKWLRAAEFWLETVPELMAGPAEEFIRAGIQERATREQRRRAEEQLEQERRHALRVSQSLRLAFEARQSAEAEPETALLVAWEALLCDRNELSETVFRETLERLPATVKMLMPPGARAAAGFTGDGRWSFAASSDGVVELWGVDSGDPHRFSVQGSGAISVAPLPRSDRLLTFRDHALRLHRSTGEVLAELALPPAPTSQRDAVELSVADDGSFLLHCDGHGWLVAVDRDALRKLGEFSFVAENVDAYREGLGHVPGMSVFTAKLDRGGRTVLSEGTDSVRIWNVGGSVSTALTAAKRPAGAAVLSDGSIVTGTMAGRGELWSREGISRGVFREEGGYDLFIRALHPRGEHFATTVNQSGVVEVRASDGEKEIARLVGHRDNVWAAAFSADGRWLASGGQDRTIRIWDWETETERFVLHGHAATVNTLAFHPTDPALLISADQQGCVRLWGLHSPVVRSMHHHSGAIASLVRTPVCILSSADDGMTTTTSAGGVSEPMDGRLIAWSALPQRGKALALTSGDADIVGLWELGAPSPRKRCEVRSPGNAGWADRPDHAVISPDGAQFVLIRGSGAALFSADGELQADLVADDHPGVSDPRARLRGAEFNDDGSRVAVASRNGTVWLWRADGTLGATLLADLASPDRIFDLACDPLGEFVAVGVRNHAALWNWDGELVRTLPTAGYKVQRVAWSPDGQRIVTISDNPSAGPAGFAELWGREGKRIAGLDAPDISTHTTPLFASHSRYFCLQGRVSVAIIDGDGARIGTLAGPLGTNPRDVCLSADDDKVAAAFDDATTRIWSLSARRRTMTLRIGQATRITFSGDGRALLVGSPSGAIAQHAIDVEDLYRAAALRVCRLLAQDELDRFDIPSPRLTVETLADLRRQPA